MQISYFRNSFFFVPSSPRQLKKNLQFEDSYKPLKQIYAYNENLVITIAGKPIYFNLKLFMFDMTITYVLPVAICYLPQLFMIICG